MSATLERRLPGFWQLQLCGWTLLYLLLLAAAALHLHESFVLAYNSWVVIVLFFATLALRPVLRLVSQRWRSSWLLLQGSVFCLCFVTGSLATFVISLITFGFRGFRLSYWTLSGVQCSMTLYLWAALYLGVRHWRTLHERQIESSLISNATAAPSQIEKPVLATTFAVRTGSRLEIVRVDEVLWIAASRDYVELHTKSSTRLLRETLTSLVQRLDRTEFIRIHRSRIVRIDQIRELIPLENGEYRIKLYDGSEHRSSRTYAPAVTEWMRSGTGESAIPKHR